MAPASSQPPATSHTALGSDAPPVGANGDRTSEANLDLTAWQLAMTDADSETRTQALYLLTDRMADRGREFVVATLEQALLDQDRLVRESVVDALGELGGDAAVSVLAYATRDADPDIRRDAVLALGAIGGAASETLIRTALLDVDEEVRLAAEDALDEMAQMGPVTVER